MTPVRAPHRPANTWIPLPGPAPMDDTSRELWRLRTRWTADARLCAACQQPLLPVTGEQTRHPTCYPTDDTYRKAHP